MALKSWLPIPQESPFSLANIPFGCISPSTVKSPRPAIAVGDHVLDLAVFAANDGFSGLQSIHTNLHVFSETTLNAFAALGRPIHRQVRAYLQEIFAEDGKHPELLKDNQQLKDHALVLRKDVQCHLPMRIGDYTDFYVGKNHAYNCGVMFRPESPLSPNYTHMPIGYHGRASSVVVSGTPIHRPSGQILPDLTSKPVFSSCRKLDFELELGALVCQANKMGEPIPVDGASEHIFGFVLMNDWSARDIQLWEMAPLGPFNAKNFGTSISAWVVLADALEEHRSSGIENDTEILPYLQEGRKDNVYDINLEVDLTSECHALRVIRELKEPASKIWCNDDHHAHKCEELALLVSANASPSFNQRLSDPSWRFAGLRHHQWD